MLKKTVLILIYIFTISDLFSQQLELPLHSKSDLNGTEFSKLVEFLPLDEREALIFSHILDGNIPEFLRKFSQITIHEDSLELRYFVLPDYLAIGSNEDFIAIPMTPILAQKLADTLHCVLPTKKMVDQIYSAAKFKLRPQPIPPSTEMTNYSSFIQHNDSILVQKKLLHHSNQTSELIAGSKKDIIISNKIRNSLKSKVPHPVVIYGWHQLNGNAIQPVYNGHHSKYADYSHGTRLVHEIMYLNNKPIHYSSVLKDSVLSKLISDEGVIEYSKYD